MKIVCIPFTTREHEQTNWDYLLSNFKVDEVFIIGKKGDELPSTNVYGKGTFITSYSELPKEGTVILLAPNEGTYLKGTQNILDFVHPENAIYIVGPNHRILDESDFEGCTIEYKVYIPNDTKDEMFNWSAMTVMLYDRKIKAYG